MRNLVVDPVLRDFVEGELLPGLPVDPDAFWSGLAEAIDVLMPRNTELLAERDRLQQELDVFHGRHGLDVPAEAYRAFLQRIGYLRPPPAPFTINPRGIAPEIADVAAPQLVVPLSNARYALNAANARWGSLYDALYGTDALGSLPPAGSYDAARGADVIAFGRQFLDRTTPLQSGSHSAAVRYRIAEGALVVELEGGGRTSLQDPDAFVGWRGPAASPTHLLLRHHGLHIELVIDFLGRVGGLDRAGIQDIVLESALTTIFDLEDSVATVDAVEKVAAYRNWLGLVRGDLSVRFEKGGRQQWRRLNAPRGYAAPDGQELQLPGRSLFLVRNVGQHLETDMVAYDGQSVPETFVDAFVTAAAAMHGRAEADEGSIYIVKPKMHGPDEVAFAVALFEEVETTLGLPRETLKIGIMDEERRTTLNLASAIAAARSRVFFINTGFLDRTGDEIHSLFAGGAVVRKAAMRDQPWLAAYELQNVAVGLACGFRGRAQIGKGMWAAPDSMAAMLQTKIGHPRAGASTAWVPSPTAATLHALHYHEVDVAAAQAALETAPPPDVGGLLTPPFAMGANWSSDEIAEELANNCQGILGYVVRWIQDGVGCSKVPDIHNVGLMEDRATLRISSQHVANWLRHGVCSAETVQAAMTRMAAVVDTQNGADPAYQPMGPDFEASDAFQAACHLVFFGDRLANGYVEPVLYEFRRRAKARGMAADA